EDGIEPVRGGFVRTHETEIPGLGIEAYHLAQMGAHEAGRLGDGFAWSMDIDGEALPVRQDEVLLQHSAIGMRQRSHALVTVGSKRSEFRQEATVAIEQLLRSITAQPVFEDLAVGGITPRVGYRDLVRSPEVLDLLPVDFLRSGPAFRAAQDNHGPARPLAGPVFSAGLQLYLADTVHRPVQGISHGPVHRNRVLTLDEQRFVA